MTSLAGACADLASAVAALQGRLGQAAPPTSPPPAPSSAWPDATNTGVPMGVMLRRVPQDVTSGPGWHWNGSYIVVDNNSAVLDALDIESSIVGQYAQGVTYSRLRVRGINEADWILTTGPNAKVTDCEIGGGADGTTYQHAVGLYLGSGSVGQRLNVHHQINGVRLEADAQLLGSWVHAMPMGDVVVNPRDGSRSTDNHSGGVMTTRCAGALLKACRVEGGNSAALFAQRDVTDKTAVIGALTVANTLFEAVDRNGQQPSFGVDIENKQPGTNGPITVTGNVFSLSGWQVGFGQLPAGATVSGNTDTNGKPVSFGVSTVSS